MRRWSCLPGFRRTAVTSNALAAIANEERRIWAVQFHPEVHHTPLGPQLIKNFVFDICGATGDWTPAHFIQTTVEGIRAKVGSGHVICGLSGGVDSSVAAMLVHKAIGSQLTCIFVNNGVLRKNEFAKCAEESARQAGAEYCCRGCERAVSGAVGRRHGSGDEAEEDWRGVHRGLRRRGESDCEERPGGVDWLVQGTLYPDVIESSSVKGPSQTIKSHHNVGGLPLRHEAETD